MSKLTLFFITRTILLLLWMLFIFIIDAQTLEASEWYRPDYISVRTFYGESKWTKIGPDPADDYQWTNVSLYAGKNVWSWFDILTGLGIGYLKSDDFGSTQSVEWRLLGNVKIGYFFFEFGGGLAYLFDRDNLPELANSSLYVIVSGGLGLEFHIYESEYQKFSFKTGYRVEHISSPFHSDKDDDIGWNIGAIEATFTWRF